MTGILSITGRIEINVEIYRVLFELETCLRELVIEEMENAFGSKWWKSRISDPIIRQSFISSIEYERLIPWSTSLSYHPMYYVDFPHIRQIMAQKKNWSDVFQSVFKDGDVMFGVLRGLEPIRNKVAHNRAATPADLSLVQTSWNTLRTMIGENRTDQLLLRDTHADDIMYWLGKVQEEFSLNVTACLHIQPAFPLEAWNRTKRSWWFDSEYLGANISSVCAIMSILEDYCKLPRSRGAIVSLSDWVKCRNIEVLAQSATACFHELSTAHGA